MIIYYPIRFQSWILRNTADSLRYVQYCIAQLDCIPHLGCTFSATAPRLQLWGLREPYLSCSRIVRNWVCYWPFTPCLIMLPGILGHMYAVCTTLCAATCPRPARSSLGTGFVLGLCGSMDDMSLLLFSEDDDSDFGCTELHNQAAHH